MSTRALARLSRPAAAQHPVALFWAALTLRRSRQRLADLDDHILADIGLTREEAESEARRAAWDAPEWWGR